MNGATKLIVWMFGILVAAALGMMLIEDWIELENKKLMFEQGYELVNENGLTTWRKK